MSDLIFDVLTPLGFSARGDRRYWKFIVTQKHPVLATRENEARKALEDPDEIRRSRKDPDVDLFYNGCAARWICAVVRRENSVSFLVTAYLADAIKAGEVIGTKSE